MLAALAILPAQARAQGVALAIGNTIPVENVFGRNWPGTNDDPGNSCPVEIRRTWTGGLILAPSNDPAQLDAFNPLVTNTYLGRGVIGVNSGTYAETFTNRSVLATNLQYYVRVFDRPPGPTPVYYADTLPFYPPATDPSINPEFGALKRVDGTFPDPDSDGDGIPDAMEGNTEGLWGLDPGNPDTDGDGYDDFFEVIHDEHLQPTEKDRSLEIQINAPQIEAGPYTVSWWTIPVPAMTYRLQFRPQFVDGDVFSNVWTGAATETLLDIDVQEWVGTNDPPKGFFRVTVPYERP